MNIETQQLEQQIYVSHWRKGIKPQHEAGISNAKTHQSLLRLLWQDALLVVFLDQRHEWISPLLLDALEATDTSPYPAAVASK